jgi:hypothetical protein
MAHKSSSKIRTSFSAFLQSARDAVGLLEHELRSFTRDRMRIDILEKRALGDQHRLGHEALLNAGDFDSGSVPNYRKNLSFGFVCFPPKDGPKVGESFAFEILLLIHKSRYSVLVKASLLSLLELTPFALRSVFPAPLRTLYSVENGSICL